MVPLRLAAQNTMLPFTEMSPKFPTHSQIPDSNASMLSFLDTTPLPPLALKEAATSFGCFNLHFLYISFGSSEWVAIHSSMKM